MYGLVNQAMRDLLIKRYGKPRWEEICKVAKISSEDFNLVQDYPDALTDQIISAAQKLLGLSPEELLKALGFYWITYTANEGYGDLMAMFGRDFKSCLKNLNRMHSQMGAMLPKLEPPKFLVEDQNPQKILIHYYSIREGLAPMVIGLLEGLAHKFQDKIKITHFKKNTRSDHDEFEVEFESVPKGS